MSALRIENVRAALGTFVLEASVTLARRVTGVFGASGAGKTTLLEIIAGLRRPDSGKISLDGRDMTDCARRVFVRPERRGIGYVPQDLALFPHLSVEQNLRFGAPSSGEGLGERYQHLVETLHLDSLLGRGTAALSGGEKQRVAIGRALMSNPRLLLLDEPMANLDAGRTLRLLDLLKATANEFQTPIIYVTHDAAELASICDEVLVLDNGRVARQGDFSEVFENSGTPLYVLKGIQTQKAPGT